VPEVYGIASLSDEELGKKSAEIEQQADEVVHALAELAAGGPAKKTVEARQAYELELSKRTAAHSAAFDRLNGAISSYNAAVHRHNRAQQIAESQFNTASTNARAATEGVIRRATYAQQTATVRSSSRWSSRAHTRSLSVTL